MGRLDLTAGGDIEIPWLKSEPFAVCLPKISRSSVATESHSRLQRDAASIRNERDQFSLVNSQDSMKEEEHFLVTRRTGLRDLETLCSIDGIDSDFKGSKTRYRYDEAIRMKSTRHHPDLDPELHDDFDTEVRNEDNLDNLIDELRVI